LRIGDVERRAGSVAELAVDGPGDARRRLPRRDGRSGAWAAHPIKIAGTVSLGAAAPLP
jgi:hypothetical protein